jgi:hypothetical protein
VALVIPLAVVQLVTNTYFQILAAGTLGWSEDNAISLGYVGYLEYLSCAGIFLQIRRYLITRSRRDLIFTIIAVLLPILVYFPSGSRDRTLRVSIYPLIICLLGFQTRFSKKFFLGLAGVIMAIMVFMAGIEAYRGTIAYNLGKADLSFTDRSEILVKAFKGTFNKLEENSDSALRLWARRFADYVMVGAIVSVFPANFKFRSFAHLEYWPVYLLPNPIRPATPDFDPRESAALSEKVKVGRYSGSSPAMVIGDLYSRFSWLGIFLGMMFIGLLLRWLDKLLSRFGLLETLIYGIFLIPLAKMPHDTLLALFLFLTRNMLIALVLAHIGRRFLVKKRESENIGYRRLAREWYGINRLGPQPNPKGGWPVVGAREGQ